LISDNLRALIEYRLEQAEESLEASKILLEKQLIRPSINRSYYAMFYSVLALLATRKKETSKHSGAIALFDREFVKTGILSKGFSRFLHDAFDLRQRSDYAIGHNPAEEDGKRTLDQALSFVTEVKQLLLK
jgi:uncharacterized protein (UPF0332 family)